MRVSVPDNRFTRLIFRRQAKAAPPAPRRRDITMGEITRLTADWTGTSLTLNQMLFSRMETVRNRGRDLGLNNPWGARFLGMVRTGVVGPQGFTLNSRAVDGNVLDKRGNTEIERLWKLWMRPENCTMSHQQGFIDLCNMAITGVFRDGEFIVRKIPAAENPFGFSLAPLPVDLLDHNHNREQRRDSSGRVVQNAIKLGVEVDEWDRPVKYYFIDAQDSPIGGGYYSSISRKHIIYPADQIIHIFPIERPGQVRGVSFLVPAGTRAKMLDAYEEAVITHKRGAACKMGLFEQDPDNPAAGEYEGDGENADGSIRMEIEPGIFEKVPLGYKFTPYDPTDSSEGYTDVSVGILRSMASAWNISYNTLANNLSEVNYSSLRQGVLEDRDTWMCIQRWMIDHFVNRVFTDWLLWTLTLGNTFIPPSKYNKYLSRATFQGRRWNWVDPAKEELANKTALANRTTSRRRICIQQGDDYDEIREELKQEADDAPTPTPEQV